MQALKEGPARAIQIIVSLNCITCEAYNTLALALLGYTIEYIRVDLTIFRFND